MKKLRNLFAFLTILPFQMDMDYLVDSAKVMWLFPLVGSLIGLVAGVFAYFMGFFVPNLVVGGLALGVILLLTGLHHTDGLLDFGDAVMYSGSPERKLEIMHDQLTGAGAIGLGLITYLITSFAFVSVAGLPDVVVLGFNVPLIISGLIVVELCAKLSMVIGCWAGKPVRKGMNSPFIDAMRGKFGNLRLFASLLLSFGVALLLLGLAGCFVVFASVLSGLLMVAIGHRHFGGVTGDVLGATNEIVRMVCVVVLLAIL